MGTEESLFTYCYIDILKTTNISQSKGNGLINKFFEDVKNDNTNH